MKSLVESILDNSDDIINNANMRIENYAKLNGIIDKLHEDTLKLIKINTNNIQRETPPLAYEGYDVYTFTHKYNVITKIKDLIDDTVKTVNPKIKGELWLSYKRSVGLLSLYYIPESGGRILVYRYYQINNGANRDVKIYKKLF